MQSQRSNAFTAGMSNSGKPIKTSQRQAKVIEFLTLARVVVTMGTPGWIYRWFFGTHSPKSLERNIFSFVGTKLVRETIFGTVDAATDAKRAQWLDEMQEFGRQTR